MDDNIPEDSRTIVLEEVPDYFNELSDYLDVLSNSQRLKILKILERKPRDVRSIASEIRTSYENTKKHLDKLISVGLIRKEVGLGQQTSKGVHPVWKYSLVPGAMEAVVRNLGIFSNMRITQVDSDLKKKIDDVRDAIEDEITGEIPMIIILGGPEDGKFFLLKKSEVRIGRMDPDKEDKFDPRNDIVLSSEYSSVTRISRPHGLFRKEGKKWYIEDRGSTGGTYLNSSLIQKRDPTLLHDGDLLELAKGPTGVHLLVILPEV
ncbi:MAG TPA: FHA domain-containing protein [Methanoregulaceae archaeon]|nr:FHA domain-containing protein [Methanoregulaceae archaeon]